MRRNCRAGDLVKIILDPADSGDATRMTAGRILYGQGVSRKWRQRQELPRLWTLFWSAQLGYVVGYPDYWFGISGWRRRNPRVVPDNSKPMKNSFPHFLTYAKQLLERIILRNGVESFWKPCNLFYDSYGFL
ncbi:hypothetical protein CIPAW_11G120300 [Carya illinoinensis]|uniref:Uncharacterized protein n=1 Tax=Carya illinoinensis TaxID=32201 RepID=A0A8T1P1J4_CARIL|nr:hypothetical protein CIPAW_11G120300 [Carya illinoinensis]